MMKLVPFVSVLLLLFGCSATDAPPESTWTPEQLKEKKQLVKTVMEVHDSTMVFMDKIHISIEELNQLQANQDSIIPNIDSAIKMLEIADEEMMAWMRNYREPKDTIDYNAAKAYLLDQKKAIELVEEQTDAAIKFSNQILNNAQDTFN